ncbi:hypothetical protein [Streptomyces angustmyceticus]|uniref:hypothetical protein n=1 Tax=Streptomyces angustmyceticus TaxID=285578 RepID=UPI0021AFD590|nr:hypothetical protein [Streptomyces angustmyceticus]
MTLDAIRAVRVWTRALAVWSACAEAVFALPLAWVLYRQEFFNPAFVSDINGGWQTPDSFSTVVVTGVLVVGAGKVVRRFREARGPVRLSSDRNVAGLCRKARNVGRAGQEGAVVVAGVPAPPVARPCRGSQGRTVLDRDEAG